MKLNYSIIHRIWGTIKYCFCIKKKFEDGGKKETAGITHRKIHIPGLIVGPREIVRTEINMQLEKKCLVIRFVRLSYVSVQDHNY